MTTPLVVLSPDDLRAIVREEIRAALVTRQKQEEQGEWLTPDGVARVLGYKRRSIAGLVRRRGLPCVRVGRLLRFRRDEVEQWAKEYSR